MDALTVTAITVVILAVVGIFTAVEQWRTRQSITGVYDELKTLNEGTVGSFISATETRRVADIPPDQRTATEQYHLDSAARTEAPQGPGDGGG